MDLIIKNTFLDFAEDNVEGLQMRLVKSAPCTPQSRSECFLDDIDATLCTDNPENLYAVSLQNSQAGSSKSTSDTAKLQLATLVELPPCDPKIPTLGSANHSSGLCKPCSFFWRSVGCGNGANCTFCHYAAQTKRKDGKKKKKCGSGPRVA